MPVSETEKCARALLECEADLFDDGDGLARQLQPVGVEGPRHQGALTRVEQVARRRVSHARFDVEQQAGLLRVERAEEDRALLPRRGAGDVQEVAAVGQEVGPCVDVFVARLVERGQGLGRAAGGGDAVEALRGAAGEDDDPFAIPRAAHADRVRQRLRRPARDVKLLELPRGDKTYGAAVRRPEGLVAGFGPGQLLRVERVERPQPEALSPGSVPDNQDHAAAVGRDQGARL